MFKGKPILAGSSDLNQIQLIFNLVGTPTEETMPGWSSLPGCEGVRNFGYKLGNLSDTFRELVPCLACTFVFGLPFDFKMQDRLEPANVSIVKTPWPSPCSASYLNSIGGKE